MLINASMRPSHMAPIGLLSHYPVCLLQKGNVLKSSAEYVYGELGRIAFAEHPVVQAGKKQAVDDAREQIEPMLSNCVGIGT